MKSIATFLACVLMAAEAFAQKVPAPRWCADLLARNPASTAIIDLYGRVRAAIPPKGEFETTADFERRAKEQLVGLNAYLAEGGGLGRVVVSAPVMSRYDADKGQFVVGILSMLPMTGLNELQTKSGALLRYDAIAVEGRQTSAGEYVAQNAYGVTRNVASETREQFGVALTNLVQETSWLRGQVAIPVKPNRAAEYSGKLSALIIGDLVPPGTVEGYSRVRPTVQNPKDLLINKHYVTISASCGGIIATDTGELLYRLN